MLTRIQKYLLARTVHVLTDVGCSADLYLKNGMDAMCSDSYQWDIEINGRRIQYLTNKSSAMMYEDKRGLCWFGIPKRDMTRFFNNEIMSSEVSEISITDCGTGTIIEEPHYNYIFELPFDNLIAIDRSPSRLMLKGESINVGCFIYRYGSDEIVVQYVSESITAEIAEKSCGHLFGKDLVHILLATHNQCHRLNNSILEATNLLTIRVRGREFVIYNIDQCWCSAYVNQIDKDVLKLHCCNGMHDMKEYTLIRDMEHCYILEPDDTKIQREAIVIRGCNMYTAQGEEIRQYVVAGSPSCASCLLK